MRTTRLFFAMLACAALMAACSDDNGGDPTPTPLAFADNAAYDIPASTVGTAIASIGRHDALHVQRDGTACGHNH